MAMKFSDLVKKMSPDAQASIAASLAKAFETREATMHTRRPNGRVARRARTTKRDGAEPSLEEVVAHRENPDMSDLMWGTPIVWPAEETDSKAAMVTIQLDREVFDWYKRGGPGRDARINRALRAFMGDRATPVTARRAKKKKVG